MNNGPATITADIMLYRVIGGILRISAGSCSHDIIKLADSKRVVVVELGAGPPPQETQTTSDPYQTIVSRKKLSQHGVSHSSQIIYLDFNTYGKWRQYDA